MLIPEGGGTSISVNLKSLPPAIGFMANLAQRYSSDLSAKVSAGDALKDISTVTIFRESSDSTQTYLNKEQKEIMYDFYTEKGEKFRDSIKNKYFDFNGFTERE